MEVSAVPELLGLQLKVVVVGLAIDVQYPPQLIEIAKVPVDGHNAHLLILDYKRVDVLEKSEMKISRICLGD